MTGTVPPSMTYSLPWIEAARSDLLGAARSADRDASERVHQRLAGGVLVGTCFFGQPSDQAVGSCRFDEAGRDRVDADGGDRRTRSSTARRLSRALHR